ncbi:type VI secretion system baseplate subunit TssF [Chromobacterium haemolyticum]|uniref:type VI secretion system baseplate subunit TssF n=1 Tax=Chromobacterium haemolyticum TaxID=394935 RepID=UPI001964DF0A|nr:type VI secretion system baseplate subunit TssF [Chromobacterium haemolyticum]
MESLDPRLLDYYQRELAYLRHAGGEFAHRYPKVAHRLQLSDGECPDPQVERLLEGFALLCARLQRRLDDDYSELTDALLEQLYPHALRPMPSCAIARFEPDPDKGKLDAGYRIERGTPLFVATTAGDSLRFRTSAAVTLWPLRLAAASLLTEDEAQAASGLAQARAALVLRLEKLGPEPLGALPLNSLRIHLAGSPLNAAALYDLLSAHSLQISCRLPERPGLAPSIRPGALPHACGFSADEALLPAEDGVHPAYALLAEYFACPEKFAFFDLPLSLPRQAERQLEIVIAFERAPAGRLGIQHGDIALGCAPVINLFPHTSEPLRPDGSRSEYLLVADAHRDHSVEIHSIRQLRAAGPDGARRIAPYFACSHGEGGDGRYWHARRVRGLNRLRPGSDMLLTLVDADFDPLAASELSLTAELLCTNRHLAEQLPAGAPLMFELPGPVGQARLLRPPRPQTEAALDGASRWKLVSQLSLNHLSLSEGPQALAALREMLALHNLGEQPAARRQIEGIAALGSERIVDHVGADAWRGWRNGLLLTLELDPACFAGGSRVLFAAVLAHFFALYAHANRFVRTRLVHQQQEIQTWQPPPGPSLVL